MQADLADETRVTRRRMPKDQLRRLLGALGSLQDVKQFKNQRTQSIMDFRRVWKECKPRRRELELSELTGRRGG